MKKTLVMASLVAASTSMMAMDLEYFLGAGAERMNADFKISSQIDSEMNGSGSMKDTALKLKAGVILDKTHRISISHVKHSEDRLDATSILGNYDYLIPMNEQFRLYAGLHLGNTKVEVEDGFEDINDNISFSGLAYGTQIGAIYDITKNIEFELGLSYTKFNVERAESEITTTSGTHSWAKIELEDSTSMFAGINYKF